MNIAPLNISHPPSPRIFSRLHLPPRFNEIEIILAINNVIKRAVDSFYIFTTHKNGTWKECQSILNGVFFRQLVFITAWNNSFLPLHHKFFSHCLCEQLFNYWECSQCECCWLWQLGHVGHCTFGSLNIKKFLHVASPSPN